MSKFIISGYGYVGKATNTTLFHAGIKTEDIAVNDPFKNLVVEDQTWKEAAWHLICVPTPSTDVTDINGAPYDSSIVEEAMELARIKGFTGYTVIRSTLEPQTVQRYYDDNPSLVVWPELLRKNTWKEDAINPVFSIAGGWAAKLLNEKFNDKFKIANIMNTPVEACIVKLAINSLLAARTIQAYNLKRYVNALGYSYDSIAEMLSKEPRLGYSHWLQPGPDGDYGYGGSCFPKDTAAMAKAMMDAGVHYGYAEWAHGTNTAIKDDELNAWTRNLQSSSDERKKAS